MNEQKERIIEGNKLIAEFMGYQYFPYNSETANKIIHGWRKPTKGHIKISGWYLCRTSKDLQYCSSWDWLKPVIDKIKYMQHDPKEMFMGTTLERSVSFTNVTALLITVNNVFAFNQVVKFIEWYNQQKSQL